MVNISFVCAREEVRGERDGGGRVDIYVYKSCGDEYIYIYISLSLFPLWLQQVEVATTKQEKKKREFRTAANVKKKKRRKKN